jgi:hypothetical protein
VKTNIAAKKSDILTFSQERQNTCFAVVDEGMKTSTYFGHAQWVQNCANLLPVVVVVREVVFAYGP